MRHVAYLLLPDFETVDVHVVLDILERSAEARHLGGKYLQTHRQL